LPHEDVRGGTAKLRLLFRPATGEVRTLPVTSSRNAVLHPWLKAELEQILAQLSPSPRVQPGGEAAPPDGRWWKDWGWSEGQWELFRDLPPVRLILIWDNLQGHYTWDMMKWCYQRGILLLYTPLSGSWLNMAESMLRILVRRALAGQHPQNTEQLMEWLAATARGGNVDPTPFEWGGRRAQRRQRVRERRHGLGGSGACTRRALPRRDRAAPPYGDCHAN
jgi:DDE superfamily endonuclease